MILSYLTLQKWHINLFCVRFYAAVNQGFTGLSQKKWEVTSTTKVNELLQREISDVNIDKHTENQNFHDQTIRRSLPNISIKVECVCVCVGGRGGGVKSVGVGGGVKEMICHFLQKTSVGVKKVIPPKFLVFRNFSNVAFVSSQFFQ